MSQNHLSGFPLAWRWTDANYALLPPEALAQLIPCQSAEAARLFDYANHRFCGKDGLSPDRFVRITRQNASVPRVQGCAWLRGQVPDTAQQVVLSWQPDTAVRTTWQLFTERWDDFCYGASDDLLAWPESEEWVLLYHHEEEFQLGQTLIA